MNRGLVIVRMRLDGRWTSVSMDAGLWGLLVKVMGGKKLAEQWVIDEAIRLNALRSNGLTGGEAVGLSRLVCRSVYEELGRVLDGVVKK